MYHEAFQVLLKGLTSDELSLRRRYYQFDKVPMMLQPVQKPHPPLWYGVTFPANAAWPAENDVNIVGAGSARRPSGATSRTIGGAPASAASDRNGTLTGVSRHLVVADTDERGAGRSRGAAYPRWRE